MAQPERVTFRTYDVEDDDPLTFAVFPDDVVLNRTCQRRAAACMLLDDEATFFWVKEAQTMRETRPATVAEAGPLMAALERAGYELVEASVAKTGPKPKPPEEARDEAA
ncbi:MAG: hypothetical protein GHCLOJNM_01551 [bacterium]|nr:hypothetical protein [bacterium]